MAAAADRLSDLSDDILTNILSFLPSSEAASATALSRRWRRPLWLHTGAVHIDYRSYLAGGGEFPDRQCVLDDADQAFSCFYSRSRFPEKVSIVMPNDAIVIDAGATDDEHDAEDPGGIEAVEDADTIYRSLPVCMPRFAAIRRLELTGYDLQPYSDQRRQLAFPRLEAMRLEWCRTELATIQSIISAAPRLADLRLDSLCFLDRHYVYRLRCEAATSIVIANCGVLRDKLQFVDCSVHLDAPGLRRFRYAHAMAFESSTSFSLGCPTPPHLEQVHLEVHSAAKWVTAYPRRSILAGFSCVRSLKLTAYSIADLDIKMMAPPLPDFHSLEQLEIEELCGWSGVNHAAASKAVVNLLCRSPTLLELRVRFRWMKYLREDINAGPADEMAAIADFSLCRSVHEDAEIGNCCRAIDERFSIGHSISGLRRVVVEFDAEELTCFQARLIWFLADCAMDLQEFFINGGKGYGSSHIDPKVARWMKRRRRNH